jgi:hypothetical protein
MWWREQTLDEQLDAVLQAEPKEHLALFNEPQREPAENYQLGMLLLRRHGIRLHPHRKGPLSLHFAEGLPEEPEQATQALQQAFSNADNQLREFWEPLWQHESKGPLRQHTRWLLRREEAIRANTAHWGEMERLRAEVAKLRAELKALKRA